jgi:hypothetical protein
MAFSAIMIRWINLVFRSELYIPPKDAHMSYVLSESWLSFSHKVKNRFRTSLEVLSSTQKKESDVFIIWFYVCRLWAFTENSSKNTILQELESMTSRENMPNLGMVPMLDAWDRSDANSRHKFKTVRFNYEKYNEQLNYFKDTFSKSGSSVVNTRVDESYVTKLLGYFKSR